MATGTGEITVAPDGNPDLLARTGEVVHDSTKLLYEVHQYGFTSGLVRFRGLKEVLRYLIEETLQCRQSIMSIEQRSL